MQLKPGQPEGLLSGSTSSRSRCESASCIVSASQICLAQSETKVAHASRAGKDIAVHFPQLRKKERNCGLGIRNCGQTRNYFLRAFIKAAASFRWC